MSSSDSPTPDSLRSSRYATFCMLKRRKGSRDDDATPIRIKSDPRLASSTQRVVPSFTITPHGTLTPAPYAFEYPGGQFTSSCISPLSHLSCMRVVRMLALPLPPDVSRAVVEAGSRIKDMLPPDWTTPDVHYSNPAETMHISVFHVGRPEAPCLSVDPDGIADERATLMDLIGGSLDEPLELEIVDLAFSDSGVLVLLMGPCGSNTQALDRVRLSLKDAFPQAPASQAHPLIHTSVWRCFASTPMSHEEADRVQLQLELETKQLRETFPRFHIDRLWYILERYFASVEGERETWSLLDKQVLEGKQEVRVRCGSSDDA